MPPGEPHQEKDKPQRDQSKSTIPEARPEEMRPDKNVVVPKFDILTEGYDPAKIKNKSSS